MEKYNGNVKLCQLLLLASITYRFPLHLLRKFMTMTRNDKICTCILNAVVMIGATIAEFVLFLAIMALQPMSYMCADESTRNRYIDRNRRNFFSA